APRPRRPPPRSWPLSGAPSSRRASSSSAPTAACSRAISPSTRWASAGRRSGTRSSASPRERPPWRSRRSSAAPPVGRIGWTDLRGGAMSRTKFVVDDPMTRNAIHVLSRAPLETILVRANDVKGEIEVDPDDVTDRPRVTFEVPIDALDSGVPLMNDVMRGDRWLDAAKSSHIRFTLGRVLSPAGRTPLTDGKPLVLTAEGPLELPA